MAYGFASACSAALSYMQAEMQSGCSILSVKMGHKRLYLFTILLQGKIFGSLLSLKKKKLCKKLKQPADMFENVKVLPKLDTFAEDNSLVSICDYF